MGTNISPIGVGQGMFWGFDSRSFSRIRALVVKIHLGRRIFGPNLVQ